jgi:hypothetical protein
MHSVRGRQPAFDLIPVLTGREHAHYQVDPRGVRRPGPQGQGGGVNPLSQMGPAVLSAGGKMNGLSFEHVVQKLQVGFLPVSEFC